MDLRLKLILDKYFPWEDYEYGDPEAWQKKRQLRLTIEKVLIEYNETTELNIPINLTIDMVDIIKNLTEEN